VKSVALFIGFSKFAEKKEYFAQELVGAAAQIPTHRDR
jgi:hypothetical protein